MTRDVDALSAIKLNDMHPHVHSSVALSPFTPVLFLIVLRIQLYTKLSIPKPNLNVCYL